MEESAFPFNSKDKKAKKLLLRRQHVDDIKSETSTNETCKQKATKGKSGWKSFINLFVKSDPDRITRKAKRENKEAKQREKVSELFLTDIKDDFAMAISLPEHIKGRDVQVSIEMKAIGKQDLDSLCQEGLNIINETPSRTTFSGNIRIPTETTIEGISKMPLYFVSTNTNGEHPQKIETVIKPMADNLPSDIDRNMAVSDINLKVNLQNVTANKTFKEQIKQKSLQYMFVTNKSVSKQSKLESKTQLSKQQLQSEDVVLSKSELQSQTEDIVEKISQEKHQYDEESKAIVKEILSQVVTKVQMQDTSTQYVDLVTKVNKEIDVQRSLLLKINSEKDIAVKDGKLQPYLARISERDEDSSCIAKSSEESLYPRSTTYTHHDSTSMLSSDDSYLCVKATNTAPTVHKPRFIIKYDNLFGEKKFKTNNDCLAKPEFFEDRKNINYISIANAKGLKYPNNQNGLTDYMRADIDKTLELLETAKHKLLSYLDRPFNLNDYNNFKQCEYLTWESTGGSDTETKLKTSVEQEMCNRYLKEMRSIRRKNTFDENKRFFLGNSKNEETLSIVEIPNNDIVLYRSQTQVENDMLLDERYSGHCKQALEYSLVESDIQTMIGDLLAESENIKHIINQNLDPNYNLASIVDEEIKHNSTNSGTIEEVCNLIGDVDPPNSEKPIQLNYCIIDTEIKGDPSKALLDIQQKETIFPNADKCKIPKTSWNFGETCCQLPTVTVKRLCPAKHHSNFQTSNNLIHNVEKGSAFLKEICEEICIVMITNDDDSKKEQTPTAAVVSEETEVTSAEPSQFFAANEPKFHLKKAGKLAGYEENVDRVENAQHRISSSTDEVLAVTALVSDEPVTKHCVPPAHYSSSSSEDDHVPSKRVKVPVKKGGVRYENSTSAYTLYDSDYEADTENTSNLLMPLLRNDYVSVQDFNNQDEIAYIEENLKRNDELNVPEPEQELKKEKKPFIYKSEESVEITSLSSSSDYSLELSKPLENN